MKRILKYFVNLRLSSNCGTGYDKTGYMPIRTLTMVEHSCEPAYNTACKLLAL